MRRAPHLPGMTTVQEQVALGLEALVRLQLPTGEIPSFASPLDQGEPVWVPDQLNFITALAATALADVDHPHARGIVDRAVRFLLEEREGPGLWRYWSRSSPQVDFTPPDADDTACCSLAVHTRGHATPGNVAILEATRAEDGRFHTWLLPPPGRLGPRTWWALRDERRKATVAMRAELWATTEAEPFDIDAVVNANVCRYLGPSPLTGPAADWVASVVREGTSSGDRWHRSRFALWAAAADGGRRKIPQLAELGPVITGHIADAAGADGSVGTSYETGLALAALVSCDGPQDLRAHVARGLAARQGADGTWPRDICYHGGPREVFAWASEALTTAVAVGALARQGAEP